MKDPTLRHTLALRKAAHHHAERARATRLYELARFRPLGWAMLRGSRVRATNRPESLGSVTFA